MLLSPSQYSGPEKKATPLIRAACGRSRGATVPSLLPTSRNNSRSTNASNLRFKRKHQNNLPRSTYLKLYASATHESVGSLTRRKVPREKKKFNHTIPQAGAGRRKYACKRGRCQGSPAGNASPFQCSNVTTNHLVVLRTQGGEAHILLSPQAIAES